MILQAIDPSNIYLLAMDKNELSDLIEVVEWFAKTEADLHLQKKWQNLLDDLLTVKNSSNEMSFLFGHFLNSPFYEVSEFRMLSNVSTETKD